MKSNVTPRPHVPSAQIHPHATNLNVVNDLTCRIDRQRIRDAAVSLMFSEVELKITLHVRSSLVAFLGSFGEQLHHDGRDTGRHTLHLFVGWFWRLCDMSMHTFNRIG